MQGTIQISALQKGGDPSQLPMGLSTSVLHCDINNIGACQQCAEDLIKYANSEFPS